MQLIIKVFGKFLPTRSSIDKDIEKLSLFGPSQPQAAYSALFHAGIANGYMRLDALNVYQPYTSGEILPQRRNTR